MTKSKHSIEELIDAVRRPLGIATFCCLMYSGLILALSVNGGIEYYEDKDYVEFTFGTISTCLFPIKNYFWTLGGLTFFWLIITFFVDYVISNLITLKFTLIIVSSLVVLISLIWLTGGILDSPYTGATSIFISSFFIIQEKRVDLYSVNTIVLVVIGIAIFAPYFFVFDGCKEENIINWNNNLNTNILRIFGTLGLMIIAGLSSKFVNAKLS